MGDVVKVFTYFTAINLLLPVLCFVSL